MTDVVICPKCNGQKIVREQHNISGDITTWTTASDSVHNCRVCDGKGYIVIGDYDTITENIALKDSLLQIMETCESLMDESLLRQKLLESVESMYEELLLEYNDMKKRLYVICKHHGYATSP